MILDFFVLKERRQGKVQRDCAWKINCNTSHSLAKTRKLQVYLMTWNRERWNVGLRAAYGLLYL